MLALFLGLDEDEKGQYISKIANNQNLVSNPLSHV